MIKAAILSLAMLFATAHAALSVNFICFTAQDGEAMLRQKYGEVPIMKGLGNSTIVDEITVWVNKRTGTWTITRKIPGNLMCFIASGKFYKNLDGTPINFSPHGREDDPGRAVQRHFH